MLCFRQCRSKAMGPHKHETVGGAPHRFLSNFPSGFFPLAYF